MPTNNFKVGEMLNKRTPNSKTWMNFDGSYTTEIHASVVHYQDENGNLQNINTDLYDEADFDSIDFPVASDGDSLFFEARDKAENEKKRNRLNRDNFDFQGLKVPFETKLPRNIKRGYSIGKGASKLKFIPVDASPSKGYVEGNKITYQDAWNDTDLILEVLPDGIKETIILKSERAPFNFSFEVQGNLEGEMKIQPPWLQDAEGTKRDVVQGVSELEGKIFLNLAADVSGLVYPIEIDPTVIISTFVKEINVTTQATYNSGTNYLIGTSSGNVANRLLTQFDISIPSGAVIESAFYNAYCYGLNSSGLLVYINAILEDWGETSTFWNNIPDTTYSASGTPDHSLNLTRLSAGWDEFPITKIIQKWINGQSNYGIMIQQFNDGGGINNRSYRGIRNSTNKPYVTINYNIPPTTPSVTVPNGGESWNSLHAIKWNAATDFTDVKSIGTDGNTTDSFGFGFSSGSYGQKFLTPSVGAPLFLKETYVHIANGYGASFDVILMDGNFNKLETISITREPKEEWFKLPSFQTQLSPGTFYFIAFNPLVKNTRMTLYRTVTNKISGDIYSSAGYESSAWSMPWGTNTDLEIQFVFEHISNQLRYQIQLSPDNGVSWKDIVSLTGIGVTTYNYDFINEPETSLAKLRIRAFDGSAYGPWDESDGVFTIQHNKAPTAPTNLNPSGGSRDRAADNLFSWQHNDENADPQAKFDLQWRLQGSPTWNEITQTTVNQFYEVPANLFPRGTIEWRVRTHDQADLSSPYSAIAIFFAGDKPAVPTIVSPGASVAVANPTVQWSSTDQTGLLLTVKDAAGTTLFSRERNSTNKAETITYSLENQQNYTIELKIKNADGLYSDAAVLNIFVSYTPPAVPDIETVKGNSFIQIYISDPVPTGTQPTVLYHDIYKQIEGESVLIATGIQGEYKDYHVASNENVRYFVRSQGDNETFIDTSIFTESVSFRGVWLHIVDDKENTIYQFKFDGDGRSSNWGVESAMHRFQGRKNPVIETGQMQEYSVEFSLKIENELERIALERITFSQQTVCYRDGRGRKVFGVFVEVPLTDERWGGYSTSLSLMKIDFKEEIE